MTGNYASHRRCAFIFLMVDSVFPIYCFQLTSTMLSKSPRRLCVPRTVLHVDLHSVLMGVLWNVLYLKISYLNWENSLHFNQKAQIFLSFLKSDLTNMFS